LVALAKVCQKRQVKLILCGLNHQPLDIASRTGLLNLVGNNVGPNLASALESAFLAEKY